MEKEKPYQPSEEEIQKAEEAMTDEQKREASASHSREKIYKKIEQSDVFEYGNPNKKGDEIKNAVLKINEDENGSFIETHGGERLTIDEALEKLNLALAYWKGNHWYLRTHVFPGRRQLEADRIDTMIHKLEKLKEKQEKK